MTVHFILNPKSGKRKTLQNIEDAIKRSCRKRKMSYHIYYTTCMGDATNYVRQMVKASPDRQRFICIGGDGTMNEIVNSAPCNPNVEFGVIPNGSGNDFVRNFTNRNLFSNIDAQIDGEAVPLDLIRVNDWYCVNMANIGFDCEACVEAGKTKKFHIPPSISYIIGALIVVFRKYGTRMKLTFDDGDVRDEEFTLTAIGNGQFCGGGFDSAPRAVLNDGLMDICIIKKVSRLSFFAHFGKYKRGHHLTDDGCLKFISYHQTSHFRMDFPETVNICIDGEIKQSDHAEFSVVKNGFNLVIPKGCEMKYRTDNVR